MSSSSSEEEEDVAQQVDVLAGYHDGAHATRLLPELLAEAQQLLESLPSPHAQALGADLARAHSPMASAIRQQAHDGEQTRLSMDMLINETRALLEALPSPNARALAAELSQNLARSNTPMSVAMRDRATAPSLPLRPVSAISSSSGPSLAPSNPFVTLPTPLISGEGEVSTFLAQKIAQQQWPYNPGSSADLQARATLHQSSVQLVKESLQLLQSLPDEDAACVVASMLEGNSVLAAAMRSRMPAADHARLFEGLSLPSNALDELAREGEALLNLVPEDMAADMLKILSHSASPLAHQLRDKLATANSSSSVALREFASECSVLISGLPDDLATGDTHTHTNTHTHTHTHTHTCMYIYIFVCVCVYIDTYKQTNIYRHIHTHSNNSRAIYTSIFIYIARIRERV